MSVATQLYDVPGPMARARYRLAAFATVAVVGALVAYFVYRLVVTGQFSAQKWHVFTLPQVWGKIFSHMLTTLSAFAVASVGSLIVGVLMAVGRLSDHSWIRIPTVWLLEAFRAVPVLIFMMLMYYGLPSIGIKGITPYISVVVALVLYNGSVLAEALRAGILAIPRGQSEAGYAVGLRKTQVMSYILLPQAFRSMLPVIISQLVVVLKDTSLGFIITFQELLYYAKFIGTQTQFDTPIIPASMVIGSIYVGLCLLVAGLAKVTERRLSSTPGVKQDPVEGWADTNLAIAIADPEEEGEAFAEPRIGD